MDFLEEEFEEILKIFQIESEEIMSRLNNNLLALEKKPANKDLILLLFRDAHSLKGAARMIGFNSIQSIAHKVEDILGLAKDDKLKINKEIIDGLCSSVDFISSLISKSISLKKEIYDENIIKQLELLENLNKEDLNQPPKANQVDFDLELFKTHIKDINKLLSESLAFLMQIEVEQNCRLIGVLLGNINSLLDLFQEIDHFDIKMTLEDISLKLNFVIRGSNSLNDDESSQIQQGLDGIIVKIISICEIYNIEVIDYYAQAFSLNLGAFNKETAIEYGDQKYTEEKIELPSENEKSINSQEEEEEEEEEIALGFSLNNEEEHPISGEEDLFDNKSEELCVLSDANKDLSEIADKIANINKNYFSISEIKCAISAFRVKSENETVTKILDLIFNVLDYCEKNSKILDEEPASILAKGLNYCEAIIENKTSSTDNELIIQQIEVIHQLQILEHTKKQAELVNQTGKNALEQKVSATDFSKIFDTGEIKTLRVDSTKLDTLVNQVGELMVNKIKAKKHISEINTLNQDLEEWQRNAIKALKYLKYYDKKYLSQIDSNNPIAFFIKQLLNLFAENNKKFGDAVNQLSNLQRVIQDDNIKMEFLIDDLDHLVKNIRVLPLATIFHLFGRMVRDIAQEKGKQVELEIIGSETSTDKKIIEEIKSPLIHIIRNSIDHGIETPEERLALGKNPTGKIIIKASQVNNNIIINILDDGRGINIEKIKEKALHKGYLSEEEISLMSEEQITNLIFAPGFSTGDEITSISGRGIGLDVVQTKIAQLNGKVKVLSEFNKGCNVQIELPTTMSTLKAFLVNSSNQTFAVPMQVIKTVVWKKSEEIICNNESRNIILEGKTIPVFLLSDILNIHPALNQEQKNKETILIIESENKVVGLCVDKLLGDQEILHKKLSAPLYRLRNISGVTTLISGEICLILNINDIIKGISINSLPKETKQPLLSTRKNNEEYKILLVDDSITTRTLEKNILSKAGYKIETATNPIEAFEILKFERFDLIISDVEMPNMDGFEFLEKLKTNEMYYDIPVIIMSSLGDEHQKKALKTGAIGYIVKGDFNQTEFLETIHLILTGAINE